MSQTQQYINKTTYNSFNKNKAIIRDFYKGIYHCYLINTQGDLVHKFEPNIWADNVEDDNVIFAHDVTNDKWAEALFDSNGNQLTDFKYQTIYGGVEEGFFEVKGLNWKRGHLNLSGVEVVPCIYDDGHYFKEGVSAMKLGDKWGMINYKNEIVIPFDYEEICLCNNNSISAKFNGKWGIIDKSNKKLVDFKFEEIYLYINRNCFSFPAKSSDKWGVIDIYGETLFDFIYDECDGLDKRGWYKFRKGDKWAIYSCEKNQFISDFIYDSVKYYSDGICYVELNGKCDYVDFYNNPISDFKYECVKHFYKTNLVAIYKDGKCGLMNTGGKIITPPKYPDSIKYASENMLVMEDDTGTQYVMDIEGNIVIPKREYQRFYGGYSCGYIVPRLNSGYLDKKGQRLELKFELCQD